MIARLVLCFVLSWVGLAGGAVFYFDSSASSGGDGSQVSPFNSLGDFTVTSNTTCRLKCGSVFNYIATIDEDGVVFESYGSGERPVICGRFNFMAGNGVLRNLMLNGNGEGQVVGFRNGPNFTLDSCEIVNGITAFSGYMGGGLLTITNTVIHNMLQEGIYGDGLETVQIDDCHIYDVNQYWVKGYYHLATGDGIQIGNSDHVTVNNTLIDRSGTSGKFGVIIQGCTYFEMNHSQIIGSPQDQLAKELNSQMYCAYMSGTTEAYFNDCWFYSGYSGIWNQYSGFIDVRNCKFILNEWFGMENIGNAYVESNLFYKAGYIGLGCDWSTNTHLNGTGNILYDNVINGRGFQVFDDNIWCPHWDKAGMYYDNNPIDGIKVPFDPAVTNGGGWVDISLFNGNNGTDLHLYQAVSNFVEGYFIEADTDPLKLFFDIPHKTFTVLPDSGSSGIIEIQKYAIGSSGNTFAFSEPFSGITNFSFSGWEDSVYLFTVTDEFGANLFSKYLLKNGALFDPLDLSGEDIGRNPLDVFGADAVIYSAETVTPGQPKNLVQTPYGFYFGYFLDLHTALPCFFNSLGDTLVFNPADSEQHYTISILKPSGEVMHRERNTRGLCEVFCFDWENGAYLLSVIAANGTVWADVILTRDSAAIETFTFSPASADSDSDGHTDWQEQVARTDRLIPEVSCGLPSVLLLPPVFMQRCKPGPVLFTKSNGRRI